MNVGLTKEQIAARKNGIGGSDAGIIMSGDWLDLWQIKVGEKEPEDLSDVLPVQIGIVTEPLNLHWFQKTTGRAISAQGETRTHPRFPFMRCTLDGITDGAVVQCKHVNAFSKIEEVAQRYMAQVHHEMAVCDLPMAYLSVFVGTLTYELVEIKRDDWYLAQLIDREREFWSYVEKREPPPQQGAIAAPILPTKFRKVDMTGNNLWSFHAGVWLETRADAKLFEAAAKELKGLVEPDVGEATGHGIAIKRSKAGALSIKEA